MNGGLFPHRRLTTCCKSTHIFWRPTLTRFRAPEAKASPYAALGASGKPQHLVQIGGKDHRKGRAFAYFGLDQNLSSVVLHDLVADREP